MTPSHQTALESLVGRALTQGEVEQIDGYMVDGRYPSIAAILSGVRRTVQPRMTSARGLAELFPGGPVAAEVVLMKLEGAAAAMKASADQQQKVLGSLISRQLGFLAGEGLDFGSAALRGMLDQFVTLGILTADEVVGLKSIALRPAPVNDNDVRTALGD